VGAVLKARQVGREKVEKLAWEYAPAYNRGHVCLSEREGMALMGENLPSEATSRLKLLWVNLGRIAVVTIQLGLLLIVIRTFSIEGEALFKVFAICTGGFIVHALLPMRLRMPFFVLLSLAVIFVLLGPEQGAWLIALGMLLLGLAHLPVRFAIRLVLILITGAVLVACRSQVLPCRWLATVWPIFGAMFMFRFIIYLYDLKNRAAPFGLWRSMAYFFIPPNLIFTLFPVIDYKRFSRGYYAIDHFVTYQTGVNWILRGLIQIIVYRAVYQYLPSDPGSVQSASAAALYFLRPYLLYLRISGSFHLSVGILHLFGFNLPRTNYNYLLASSFTDYWRRVNIYWKDFIQKMFFNPFYMRFKGHMGLASTLILTTGIAFAATWALHSYQWFWIRGSFPVIWQDIVFWSIMGLLVLINMIVEERRGRMRSLAAPRLTLGAAMGLALRTIGTFLVVTVSWAVWSAQSLGELGIVAGRLLHPGPVDIFYIVAALVGLGVAAILYARFQRPGEAEVETRPRFRFLGIPIPLSAFRVAFSAVGILFVVFAQLYFYYPPMLANAVNQLRNPFFLSERDERMLTRGYYEDLGDVARFNPQLAELYKGQPPDWNRNWALHRTGGFPAQELLPSRRVIMKGVPFTTNRWSMRDRDYEKAKPAGTYRLALLGSSHAEGGGVGDDQTFENITEDRLNRELSPVTGLHYEILNFAVDGWGPVACLTELRRRVFEFQPDVVIHTGVNELTWVVKELMEDTRQYYQLPYPELRKIIEPAHVTKDMDENVIREKLMPYSEDLLAWVYGHMVAECRERGVVPVAAFIPQATHDPERDRREAVREVAIAREAGFLVIDMTHAYDSVKDMKDVWLAEWDHHPNVEGNRMLADMLYAGLVRELDLGRTGKGEGPGGPSTE
jgi:hypothetical protein